MRNDISLVIPLSVLAGAPNLTPEEIVTALTNSVAAQEQLAEAQLQIEKLKKVVGSFGRSLNLILEEVNEPMAKAQALRSLSKEMQDTVKLFGFGDAVPSAK